MLTLNYRDSRPIYEQIKDGLRRMIVTGAMAQDEKLPSVRALATQLSINPNTIQKAYSELDVRGIIYSVPGRGCYVSENAAALLGEYKRTQLHTLSQLTQELAMAGIPQEDVARCVEDAYRQAKNERVERA